ncbi:hypothetical protein OPQ81_005410 [Rhizoctonia solani]|nr:hypothetical protein OPQ81_005410 [Rhizoctonia solani]
MANLDDSEISEQPGGNSQDDSSENPGPDNQRPPTQTLGRYVLHSPIESRSDSEATHKRKASDTPTLVDSNDQSAEPEVNIKRESPPYQLSGSQPQPLEPSSSSMTSFASNSTTSTGLTSDDGGATETPPDTDTDLAGYNPKYGNKADYLRRQKVRSKAIESIDEKHRRTGHRQDSKPDQKSPARPMDHGSRRANDPNGSPVRGLDPPRTHTLTSISDSNEPGSSLRHTSPLDGLPPPSFQASPRGRPPASSFRPISPTSGKYPPPRRPRDPSPTRGYRSQYLPYDDDPRPARPRPIVSSPPRGSPPRESPAPRTAIDRQALDNYTSYPRTETRSFDLRPASPIFSEAPRAAGSYSMESNSNWPARAPPRAPPPPPSRNTPPTRDLIRDRTPFGSAAIPANPNAGYRPQGLPELSNTRYNPYDPPPRRVDWPARDWESANRPTDSKPKLQDRFNMDSTWPRDSLGSHSLDDYASRPLRDEFTSHLNDDYASRYRREPSPTASRYADGFRTGFTRPPEVEGIRPMKRSRPDDGYIPRSVPGVERSRYELDGRPPASDYYRREPPRRDDEYEPRSRPPY